MKLKIKKKTHFKIIKQNYEEIIYKNCLIIIKKKKKKKKKKRIKISKI